MSPHARLDVGAYVDSDTASPSLRAARTSCAVSSGRTGTGAALGCVSQSTGLSEGIEARFLTAGPLPCAPGSGPAVFPEWRVL